VKALSEFDGSGLIAATASHATVIAELHRRCFDEPWSVFTVRQVLAMPGAFGFLAVEEASALAGKGLLGFALGRSAAGECELLSLAVTAGQRRRGVGAALLTAALDRARADGVGRMFLEVAEDNAVAQHLYQQFGFTRVGRRPRYYRRPRGEPMAALTYAVSFAD
jgi:ribosomal-protein-alanine N-acetyltransferase